jgi:hypothetical protein
MQKGRPERRPLVLHSDVKEPSGSLGERALLIIVSLDASPSELLKSALPTARSEHIGNPK